MSDIQYAQLGVPFKSPGYELKTQDELEAHARSIEKASVAMWQSLAGVAMSSKPASDLNYSEAGKSREKVVTRGQAGFQQRSGMSQ